MKFFGKKPPPQQPSLAEQQLDDFGAVAGALLTQGSRMLALTTPRGQGKMLLRTLKVPFLTDDGRVSALTNTIAQNGTHPWQKEAIAAELLREKALEANLTDDDLIWACWMLLTERAALSLQAPGTA